MNQIQALKTVRECRKRYLLYFAFTIVRKTNGGYKGRPKYSLLTQYDVISSDLYDEIKEQRDILLSLASEENSYVLVIIDRLETKIIKEYKKSIKVDVLERAYRNRNKNVNVEINFRCIDEKIENNKILPNLQYDSNNRLSKLDFFFRGPNEVPKDYIWDEGEYEGWLKFRWGDGKNAINYGKE